MGVFSLDSCRLNVVPKIKILCSFQNKNNNNNILAADVLPLAVASGSSRDVKDGRGGVIVGPGSHLVVSTNSFQFDHFAIGKKNIYLLSFVSGWKRLHLSCRTISGKPLMRRSREALFFSDALSIFTRRLEPVPFPKAKRSLS